VTTVVYALGRPRAATHSGGDCRARDLAQGRNVYGPHRFANPSDCRISNGLIRCTVGAVGTTPTLTVEFFVGGIVSTTGDYFVDTFLDTFGGITSTSAASWAVAGVLTIDSSTVTATLTQVRILRLDPEEVTVRLVVPAMADAFVTLRRGERHIRIQHGSLRLPRVSCRRRIAWTASSLTGVANPGRVEEAATGITGLHRFVASRGNITPNAGAFSLTTVTSGASAYFGAGAGTSVTRDTVADLHAQLSDATRPELVVA
jgi:hypothetical protein